MAKQSNEKVENNLYIDYLVQFGFSESLFEFIEDNAPSIHFMKKKMSKLPDLSKFTEVDEFVIADAGLTELHPSVCSLPKIEMLILPNNKLHSLPSEIGNMKNLLFLNIKGNPISSIPTDIQYLDKTRGGKLFKVAVNKADIGAENYQKLKELLPSVDIS
jgi:Leucine-rich repeat (LRR) protein